jgi:hypothetical protein
MKYSMSSSVRIFSLCVCFFPAYLLLLPRPAHRIVVGTATFIIPSLHCEEDSNRMCPQLVFQVNCTFPAIGVHPIDM